MKTKAVTLLADKEKRQFLTSLSSNDFRGLGVDVIAYVREIDDPVIGEKRYHIYGADGKRLAVANDHDAAIATAKIKDLETVTLQ